MNSKNINLDPKNILKILKHDLIKVQKYVVVGFVVFTLGLYSFLVLQIGEVAQKEPTDAQVLEQLGQVKRLSIDQDSIDKITQLEDQNIIVQSLFEEARENPFDESSNNPPPQQEKEEEEPTNP